MSNLMCGECKSPLVGDFRVDLRYKQSLHPNCFSVRRHQAAKQGDSEWFEENKLEQDMSNDERVRCGI